MKRIARAAAIVDSFLVKLVSVAAALAFLSITGLVTYAVFRRFLLKAGTAWGEELPLFFNVWFSLLAAPLVLRKDGHVAVEFVVRKLPGQMQKFLLRTINLLICAFGALLVFSANDLTRRIAGARMATVTWSLSFMYLPAVLGGALLCFWGIYLTFFKMDGKHDRDKRP